MDLNKILLAVGASFVVFAGASKLANFSVFWSDVNKFVGLEVPFALLVFVVIAEIAVGLILAFSSNKLIQGATAVALGVTFAVVRSLFFYLAGECPCVYGIFRTYFGGHLWFWLFPLYMILLGGFSVYKWSQAKREAKA